VATEALKVGPDKRSRSHGLPRQALQHAWAGCADPQHGPRDAKRVDCRLEPSALAPLQHFRRAHVF